MRPTPTVCEICRQREAEYVIRPRGKDPLCVCDPCAMKELRKRHASKTPMEAVSKIPSERDARRVRIAAIPEAA